MPVSPGQRKAHCTAEYPVVVVSSPEGSPAPQSGQEEEEGEEAIVLSSQINRGCVAVALQLVANGEQVPVEGGPI
ncbi:UNVERIFIED_CONTAM: hypothetical protein K2H54_055092 [Gekko kuhli]